MVSPGIANRKRAPRLDRLRYQAQRYLTKHARRGPLVDRPVASDLGVVAIVPVHDEVTIEPLLSTLWHAEPPVGGLEVLLLINAGEADTTGIRQRNRALLAEAKAFSAAHSDQQRGLYAIHEPALPARHAGVGLARKLAMDEALRRLVHSGRGRGLICSLDADCRVDDNYWQAVDGFFRECPKTTGASIYFEHDEGGSNLTSIGRYELYLRYYRNALRYAGHPHAFHTIGSAMVVTSDAYAAVGGMNQRRAGEDFYFLKKLMLLGGFREIVTTTVRPSGRTSDRVPFGTGQAIKRLETADALLVPPLEGFQALLPLFRGVRRRLGWADISGQLEPLLRIFLEAQDWQGRLDEIQRNTASTGTFQRRFFAWFDGLKVRQWLNYRRDQGASDIPVEAAAAALLREFAAGLQERSSGGVCQAFRCLDRDVDHQATRFTG